MIIRTADDSRDCRIVSRIGLAIGREMGKHASQKLHQESATCSGALAVFTTFTACTIALLGDVQNAPSLCKEQIIKRNEVSRCHGVLGVDRRVMNIKGLSANHGGCRISLEPHLHTNAFVNMLPSYQLSTLQRTEHDKRPQLHLDLDLDDPRHCRLPIMLLHNAVVYCAPMSEAPFLHMYVHTYIAHTYI
jgi:hypothetical protein